MKHRNPYEIRIGWLVSGAVFLLNPYFNLFDFLPDFLGYAMLLVGIGELIWSVPSLTEMRKDILILLGISAVRLAVFPMVASMPQEESPTMSLLCVFCLVAAEGYYGLRMLTSLKNGIDYLGAEVSEPLLRQAMPRIRTGLLVWMKLIGNLLPELCVLGIKEEGFIDSVTDNMSQRFLQLRNVLTVFFFIVVLIIAVCALVGWCKWAKMLRRAEGLLACLTEYAQNHPEPKHKRIVRLSGAAMLAFSIAVFFLWSYRLDNVILISPIVGGAAMLIGIAQLKRLMPEIGKETRLWSLWILLSGGNWVSQLLFGMYYGASGVAEGRGEEWFAINVVLTLICGAAVCAVLWRLGRRLVAFVMTNGFAAIDPVLARAAKEQENRRHALRLRLTLIPILALIPAALEGVEAALLFASFGTKPEDEFPLWGVYVALRLAWAVYAAIVFSQVKDAVKEKQAEAVV